MRWPAPSTRVWLERMEAEKLKGILPNNPIEEDEVNVLARRKGQLPAVTQRVCFTELPAEIRNRIYQHALPTEDIDLIVATPFGDEAMTMGVQPPIARVSRQVREETLEMSYANCKFVAYISNYDFTPFTHWIRCISSNNNQPLLNLTVHLKLLDRINSSEGLLDLARTWRDLQHEAIHVKVHKCYTSRNISRHTPHYARESREYVVEAISIAEELRRAEDFTEQRLLAKFDARIEGKMPENERWYDRVVLIW